MVPPTPATGTPFAAPASEKYKWAAIAAAAAVVIIGIFYAVVPGTGALVVSVAGPGNKPIDGVKVFIDDKKICDSAPCVAKELEEGTHIVRVEAKRFGSTAGKAYKVDPGGETPVNITLADPSPGTGLVARAEGAGLKLWVDGKEIGPLPQELKEMEPGSHKIKIGGSDRYAEYEETINVERDRLIELLPKLKVLKGEATLEAGDNADGAKILLVSGKERRPLNKKLPVRLEVSTNKQYKIVATKKGYETYEQPIEFEDGKAERTFTIALEEKGDSSDEDQEEKPRATARGRSAPRTTVRSNRAPRAAPTGGKGVLNINSIPVSRVILDGVPKGTTPVMGVKVPPGTHTVVFMHPKHGRKVRAVTVQPGKTATAAVRFP